MVSGAPGVTAFSSRFVGAGQPSQRLVVVLHGRGDSAEGFLWLPGAMSLGRLNYLLLNAPLPFEEGFAWYPAAGDPGHDIERGRARLGRLFDELERQGWPSEQILLFGFSQGCVMATDFALRWPKPLAGVIGVSGYVWFPETLEDEMHPQARRQPWLITHGTHDELLPIERTKSQVRRLKRMGLQVQWLEVRKAHSVDPGDELAAIRNWILESWP